MASGTGSLLESLIARAGDEDAPFRVAAIVVDRSCRAQEVAQRHDIPLITCRVADHADRANVRKKA